MDVANQVKKDDPHFATSLAKRLGVCDWRGAWLAILLGFFAQNFLGASAIGDDPFEILANARRNQVAQHRVLDGQLRHGETAIPFRLTLDGDEIKYEFSDPGLTLILRLGKNGPRLEEVTKKGTAQVVSEAQYDRAIRGTVITCEDLSMRFLYWPVAKIEGEQIMLTRNCWKLHVEPGPVKSQYGFVRLWIEKQSSALVRVETHDRAGNLAKRFEVKSVQKIEGGYLLKQMRVERMENGKPDDPTPTYLEINAPA